MLHDLHIGAPVRTRDGHTVGELVRVVMNAQRQATHLVVDPGLVESGHLLEAGGWEKPRERVLPVALVEAASPEAVQLAADEAQFLAQPLFERREFIALDPADAAGQPGWQSRFRLGDLISFVVAGWGLGAAPYVPPEQITYNEAPGSISIGEGTPVWRLEPHEHLGDVERVLTEGAGAGGSTITALVVRRPGIRGEHVVLPITAVRDVSGDTVHVGLTDQEIAALRPYHSDP